jgi:aspartate racemase
MAGACLHELFESQVTKSPNAIAVACAGKVLTYAELNQRANDLAHYLRELGVGPEALVGICLRRSLDSIIGLLGIMKAGGAYVPLPPDHPPKRLAHIFRDSGLTVVLTRENDQLTGFNEVSGIDANTITTVRLDRDLEEITLRTGHNPTAGAGPNNLVYVIYTSGSTGMPKGVAVENKALLEHCFIFGKHFGLGPSDRVLQFAPLSFDVSAEEIFPTLLTGGRLVIRPELTSIADFHALVHNDQITVLNLPTSYWSEWMTEVERQGSGFPPSLRLVIAGSETVTMRQVARWRRLAGKRIRWCNAYGTTESVITSTIYEPQGDELPVNVPIGRPLHGTQTRILDKHGRPTVNGEAGELYLAGNKLARGYLNEPELTRSHFLPDPFDDGSNARMCRTGDWVRMRADGNLEFFGRCDGQVNLRGFRIELAEIEAALAELPEVSEAAVVVGVGAGADKRLVAYFVPTHPIGACEGWESSQWARELRELLRRRLPTYMIPAVFVPMQKLPRHANGKIDREALPAPGAHRPELEDSFVPAADALEERLSKIWRDVLGLDAVGAEDSFFDLGGHSLHAARIVSAANALTGQRLQLRALHECPTIRQFATRLRQAGRSLHALSLTPIQPHGSKAPLFLVHGAGGGMLWGYANLSRHLGNDQPVYCFHARGLEGLEEPPGIEAMAAQYVTDLRAFKPKGPYYLGGYCFGGEVAFEMAQQLRAQGERVELLVLFNAMPPNSPFENPRPAARLIGPFLQNTWRWLCYFFHWPAAARQSFLQRKLRTLKKCCIRLFWPADGTSRSAEAAEQVDLSPYAEVQRRLWDAHLRASSHYHPQSYPGHALVFRTRIYPFFCTFDPTFGWSDFVKGKLTLKIVPGAHESILDEPYVRNVAQELRDYLVKRGIADDVTSPVGEQISAPVLNEPERDTSRIAA